MVTMIAPLRMLGCSWLLRNASPPKRSDRARRWRRRRGYRRRNGNISRIVRRNEYLPRRSASPVCRMAHRRLRRRCRCCLDHHSEFPNTWTPLTLSVPIFRCSTPGHGRSATTGLAVTFCRTSSDQIKRQTGEYTVNGFEESAGIIFTSEKFRLHPLGRVRR